VTDTVKPFGDIWTANIAAVAAGSGMPDVIVSDRPTLPKDAADGVYMNLQEWADRDGVTRDQFYDWAWDQTLYEGETYGIPHETDVRVLFWNKQLFAQAGLDPEQTPDNLGRTGNTPTSWMSRTKTAPTSASASSRCGTAASDPFWAVH
jgi:multiple sugar transport system substrate-binding protein